MLRKYSPPTTCHMSHFMCHVSGVMCLVSCVTCQVSIKFFFKQSCGASWWRVCYQLGLACLFQDRHSEEAGLIFVRPSVVMKLDNPQRSCKVTHPSNETASWEELRICIYIGQSKVYSCQNLQLIVKTSGKPNQDVVN